MADTQSVRLASRQAESEFLTLTESGPPREGAKTTPVSLLVVDDEHIREVCQAVAGGTLARRPWLGPTEESILGTSGYSRGYADAIRHH
jgi:hypothetical protein